MATLTEPELQAMDIVARAFWRFDVEGKATEFFTAWNAALTNPANKPQPPVIPDPTTPGPVTKVTSLSQNGITLRFDGEATVATYANGDFAIVKPWPRVLAIEPACVTSTWRVKNGAEINPRVRLTQGFDSAAFGRQSATVFKDGTVASYNDSLNVAKQLPLTIQAACSLVCCTSIDAISTPQQLVRPQIKASAVFTFVDTAPPAGAFRPPYAGSDKSPWLRSASGAWATKTGLPSGRPNVADLIAATDGPYTGETYPNYPKRYLHPSQQMPDYGGEIATLLGEAWLAASDASLTAAERDKLLANLVQIGIDWYGVALQAADNHWDTGGGHAEGVLETIILAGQYLGHAGMLSIRTTRPGLLFNASATIYRVPASYVGTAHGYGPEHVYMPEWGNEHQKDPDCDDVRWDITGDPLEPGISALEQEKRRSVKVYRAAICLVGRTGHALALWLQGADGKITPADPTLYIDVQRRWRYEARRRGETGQRLHYFHPWSLACWDAVGPPSEATYPRVP